MAILQCIFWSDVFDIYLSKSGKLEDISLPCTTFLIKNANNRLIFTIFADAPFLARVRITSK